VRDMLDTQAFLSLLKSQPFYAGQICHNEAIAPREPRFGQLEKPLNQKLSDCLERHGLVKLYSHQAEAINHVRSGRDVIVSTSSASGKSLCYNLPVMEAMLDDPGSTALYLFPTKALTQDQLGKLRQLFEPVLLRYDEASTFDGDTPGAERPAIRRKARIILTNPDMLHVSMLPNHTTWARFLRRLRYVVVDEAHVYRGVFGSHVACILRRLRRLCQSYGSSPQFILASATIDNPEEHAYKLLGVPCTVVTDDGAPKGGKDFVFWNPPITDELAGTRHSANIEAAAITGLLVSQGIRCLCFTRTRRLSELVATYVCDWLKGIAAGLASSVKSYRAGYLAEERHQIEKGLFSGDLAAVVATNALELGVDIGDLEATVLTGYPGTIASTWQQAGRSGRRSGRSLSFLVGLDNPLDQYIMHHPEFFFGHRFENALVNPQNHQILRSHLLCAAWELPLSARNASFFGDTIDQEVAGLVKEGLLRSRRNRYFLSPTVPFPARDVNIRSASGESFMLIDSASGSLLETLDTSHAFMQAHPGAVYLHQGDSYLVTDFDLRGRTIEAKPCDVNYYTVVKDLTDVRILSCHQQKRLGGVEVYLGEVEVTTEIVGFKKKAQLTEEILGEELLDLPAQRFRSVSLWFDLPLEAVSQISQSGLDWPGGLHATEHAAIGLLPLFTMCDRNDIGGLSTPFHPDTGQPQIFIYDACPSGVGIAERGYELVRELWRATLKGIEECACQEGCPSCIQSPKCGNNNKPLDKKAACIILRGLLGTPDE